MSNNRMCGTEEEFVYNYAWDVLREITDYTKLKQASPECAHKIAKAIEVIRSNRPEYREVYIEGLDDASVENPQ